mgnify:CR=1 FL=1
MNLSADFAGKFIRHRSGEFTCDRLGPAGKAGQEALRLMNRSLSVNYFDQLSHGYRTDRHFGAVYDHAPSGADDLTVIRGVDTREAVILNRLGVYFLPQIALWTHTEICAFSDELGMSASTLVDEQWIEQAQMQCRPRPTGPSTVSAHLPATAIRTVSLLACSLIVGCLLVYWLSLQSLQPLRGVVAADITSLRVPAESRLVAVRVKAGDEVFSGDQLLTLEKTEHLTLISQQQQRVRELGRQLQQADAQAELELVWRTREVEREISEVQTRAHSVQEVKKAPAEAVRSASLPGSQQRSSFYATTVSQSRQLPAPMTGIPNSMIFISGQSGESSVGTQRPVTRIAARSNRLVLASEPSTEDAVPAEARNIERRLQKLEEIRSSLPQQVRRAAGVESIRVQYDEASQRLVDMEALSREVAVLSPSYGKVGQVRYREGDTMSPGEVMLKILHTDRRYVLLHIPTRRVNEIHPGTCVELDFPGNGRYRGKVSNVPMLAESTIPGGQSLAAVRVEPIGKLWPEIPIGSQIDVAIASDNVF